MVPGLHIRAGAAAHGPGHPQPSGGFPRSYVELVWIDDWEAHERTGLRFGPRCAREAGACPFGVVLRGAVSEPDRARFVGYVVPAGGPWLLVLRAALDRLELPLVAVGETADGAVPTRWPSDRFDAVLLHHSSGARGIQRATICSRVLPDLGSLRPRDVTFVSGEPGLRLEIDDRARPAHAFTPG
jgi:hypothetical protein